MKKRIKRSEELVKKIIDMYTDGLSQREIAKEICSAASFVGKILRENKIQQRGKAFYAKKFNDEVENQIIHDYFVDRLTTQQLEEKYNCTNTVFVTIFKRRNLQFRECREYTRKHNINMHYFDNIDNQDKAYILGFFYADGWNISNFEHGSYLCGMTLNRKDEHILRQIKDKMESEYPIIRFNRQDKEYSKMYFANKELACRLNDLGVVPAKTFNVKFPKWLDEELIPHFIRGLMDGDGCIRWDLRSLSIVGYKDLIYDLKKILDVKLDYDCRVYRHTKSNDIRYIHIHPLDKKVMFLNWIYKDADLKLVRKYYIYLRMLEKYKAKLAG